MLAIEIRRKPLVMNVLPSRPRHVWPDQEIPLAFFSPSRNPLTDAVPTRWRLSDARSLPHPVFYTQEKRHESQRGPDQTQVRRGKFAHPVMRWHVRQLARTRRAD